MTGKIPTHIHQETLVRHFFEFEKKMANIFRLILLKFTIKKLKRDIIDEFDLRRHAISFIGLSSLECLIPLTSTHNLLQSHVIDLKGFSLANKTKMVLLIHNWHTVKREWDFTKFE